MIRKVLTGGVQNYTAEPTVNEAATPKRYAVRRPDIVDDPTESSD